MKAKFSVLANLAFLAGLPLMTPHLGQCATGEDWSRFRGPQGNGIFSAKLDLLPEGPKKLWQVKALPGKGSPVAIGGKIFLCGNAPGLAVSCIDADSGKNLWTTSLRNDGGNNTTPTVAGGKAYLLGYRGQAFCLDAQTGTNLWAKDLRTRGDPEPSWGHAGAPLIWEDLVICNVGGGAAVKKETGEVVWRHSGQGGYATPVLFTLKGKTGVAIFHGKALTARDPRSGNELWSIPWPTDRAVNACDPLFVGDKVLLSTTYGKGTALFDLASAEPRQVWFEEKLGSAYCTGILWQGCVYGEALEFGHF